MFGKCKWFSEKKGYGFIIPEDGGTDVLIHAKELRKAGMSPLREGQEMEFEVEQGTKGRRAVLGAVDVCPVCGGAISSSTELGCASRMGLALARSGGA